MGFSMVFNIKIYSRLIFFVPHYENTGIAHYVEPYIGYESISYLSCQDIDIILTEDNFYKERATRPIEWKVVCVEPHNDLRILIVSSTIE